ncbi:MAG TPA: hypothetical protein VMV92_15835 [Streptosporangiaceae bacterium]|nr:hypothetical protein [Streptosporangiaceae bacterium]
MVRHWRLYRGTGWRWRAGINGAGAVASADRAIRRDTQNVVICRLRFSLSTWDDPPQPAAQPAARHDAG